MELLFNSIYSQAKDYPQRDINIEFDNYEGVFTDMPSFTLNANSDYEGTDRLKLNMILALAIAGKLTPGTNMGDEAVVTYFSAPVYDQKRSLQKVSRWITFNEKSVIIINPIPGHRPYLHCVIVSIDEEGQPELTCERHIANTHAIFGLVYSNIASAENEIKVSGLGNFVETVLEYGSSTELAFPQRREIFREPVPDVPLFSWNVSNEMIAKILTALKRGIGFYRQNYDLPEKTIFEF